MSLDTRTSFYLSLGTWLYLAEFDVRGTVKICPPEAIQLPVQPPPQEPNIDLCQSAQPKFDLRRMLFGIFLPPLIIGIITTRFDTLEVWMFYFFYLLLLLR